MEIPLTYKIEFSKSDTIDLKLIAETPEKLIFKETRVHIDKIHGEKSVMSVYIELSKIKDEEKRRVIIDKMDFNSPIENATKITQQPDAEI